MKLIEGLHEHIVGDWRVWLKLHTTYFFAAIGALPGIWVSSPELQALLPITVVSHIAPFIGALGFLLRIRKQFNKPGPP
jgi:hypothetical protein